MIISKILNKYFYRFNICYINDSTITSFCVCDSNYPKETTFAFLKEINFLFREKFTNRDINNAHSYSMNNSFSDTLREKLFYFNENQDLNYNSKIQKLKDTLVETKDALIESAEVLEERGEHLEIVVKKANTLKGQSKTYFVKAKKFKEKVKGFDIRLILTVLSCICFGYILSTVLCGGLSLPNCFNE